MKTVKSKLFTGFALVIFVILTILSFVTSELFSYNQKNEAIEEIDILTNDVFTFVESSEDKYIGQLDRFLDSKEFFIIVIKEEKLLFTNESKYKTNRILEEAYREEKGEYFHKDDDEDEYEYEDDKFEKKFKKRKHKKEDDFIIFFDYLEKDDKKYYIYTGVDEHSLENNLEDIVLLIIILNIAIFLILLVIGNILINKTINPLKLILNELNDLKNAQDLTKRLKELKTNDEFEELINSFNTMLENIENSVENIKQFTSDASHELKTPLTVIQGEIELIKNKNSSKEELLEAIEKVDKEQKKLQEIIKNFLLLSRLEKQVFNNTKTSLDKTIFEIIESNLEKIEENNLELKLHIDDNLEVYFDEKYLNIVISNLMTNAIKYTNKGFIKIEAKKERKNIILKFSDSGIGIAKKDLENIFERFYRVDKARSSFQDGIGLGLAIVKKICEHFEAKISVESKIEKGSVFTINFKS